MIENETSNIDFVCRAIGEPTPSIIWYFNGALIDLSDTSKYGTSVFSLEQNILSILFLINAQSSDVGTYTCEAVNIVGTSKSSSVLTVNGTKNIVFVNMLNTLSLVLLMYFFLICERK